MKKQFAIILIIALQASAQNAKLDKVKLPATCTNEVADNYKGKWIEPARSPLIKDQTIDAEASKRIYAMRKLMEEFYPQPTGADAAWGGSFIETSFADQVKYEWNQNHMLNAEPVKINKVFRYQFNVILYQWYCCGGNEMCNMFPVINGRTGLQIQANYLEILKGDYLKGNEWTIDGRAIKLRFPSLGKWRGYEMFCPEFAPGTSSSCAGYALITRPGMLPYIPVSRKQFFERAIPYVAKWYDDNIAALNNPDKAEEATTRKFFVQQKQDAIKRLQDELEKTRKQNLLDSPAIVSYNDLVMPVGPLFRTEEEGGYMLVTENPNYFRKDLPKYIPQFFVLQWSGKDKMKPGDNWSYNFRKKVEEEFPIEKLQAMIDK